MLLDLCEQVVPTSDDLALVLVVDQLQLVTLPCLTHLGGGMKAGRDMNVGKRIKWGERKRERRWGERKVGREEGRERKGGERG